MTIVSHPSYSFFMNATTAATFTIDSRNMVTLRIAGRIFRTVYRPERGDTKESVKAALLSFAEVKCFDCYDSGEVKIWSSSEKVQGAGPYVAAVKACKCAR